MNLWTWLVIVGGLALAIRELLPVAKNWRKRNREWWVGLIWGLIAVGVAIIAAKQGWDDAAEGAKLDRKMQGLTKRADAAESQLKDANFRINEAEVELAQAKAKYSDRVVTEQQRKLFLEIAKGLPKLRILVWSLSSRQESRSYAKQLHELLTAGGFDSTFKDDVIGRSLTTSNNETIAICGIDDSHLLLATPLKKALDTVGIPTALAISEHATTSELELVVADR